MNYEMSDTSQLSMLIIPRWELIINLPQEIFQRIRAIYGDGLLLTLRSKMYIWIEANIRPWLDLCSTDCNLDEQTTAPFMRMLLQEINEQLNAQQGDAFKYNTELAAIADKLIAQYSNNSLALIQKLCQSIKQEYLILQETQMLPPFDQMFREKIEELRAKCAECEQEIRRMTQEHEGVNIIRQNLQCMKQCLLQNRPMTPDQKKAWEKQAQVFEGEASAGMRTLSHSMKRWNENCSQLVDKVCRLQNHLVETQLETWKRQQQLSGNGVPFTNNLDEIQNWCEAVAKIEWNIKQQIERVESCLSVVNSNDSNLPTMKTAIRNAIERLINSTFVVEKQPPQVMKTNTRFLSIIRFLVGDALGCNFSPPSVRVSIISESQAVSAMMAEKLNTTESSGEIVNSLALMEYNQSSKVLNVRFGNMQLKKIKRTEKKGTESVMDEKFCLLFTSNVKVGDLTARVKVISLPVVVIVHVNQEPHAWATVTWDNAFAEIGREPFYVPEKVPWSRVGEVLSQKFKSFVDAHLSAEDLHFLAGKAFRNSQLQDYDNMLLSWGQFSKETLPERNFTFWEWFYAILKVTKDHLANLWSNGNRCIYGFISRHKTEELLLQKPTGTFLLRYSDSEPGCVTIAYVDHQINPSILMIKPFTSKDFKLRSLADRIDDLKHLTYLYPDIPKDQAFSRYYEPANNTGPTSDGYIRTLMVTQVPLWASSGMDSYPNTPQSIPNVRSPDGSQYMENPNSVQSSNGQPMITDPQAFTLNECEFSSFINDFDCNDIDMADFGPDLATFAEYFNNENVQ